MPMASTFFDMARAPWQNCANAESLRFGSETCRFYCRSMIRGSAAIGHEPPLRVVVGLEPPGLAAIGHQHDLAAFQPPL